MLSQAAVTFMDIKKSSFTTPYTKQTCVKYDVAAEGSCRNLCEEPYAKVNILKWRLISRQQR